jgi:hypothetical protein
MKRTIDVWVAAEAAPSLTPPSLSIADGEATGVPVRVCVLREPMQKRIEISLTVDEATADEFSRACRRQTIWERQILPGLIIAALVDFVLGIVAAVRNNMQAFSLADALIIALVVCVWIGRITLRLWNSPHHPRLDGRRTVIIQGVNREAADDWVRRNTADAITLRE